MSRRNREMVNSFPVGRLCTQLKKATDMRVSRTAAQSLAGAFGFLTSELLLCAGTVKQGKIIQPRDIKLGMLRDAEFAEAFRHVEFPFSGVMPHIHKDLMMTKKSKSKKTAAKVGVVKKTSTTGSKKSSVASKKKTSTASSTGAVSAVKNTAMTSHSGEYISRQPNEYIAGPQKRV